MRPALFAISCVAALAAAPHAALAEGRFGVEIEAPAAAESDVGFKLVEVSGHAGTLRGRGIDLVIALDLSDSVLRDSGVDLDGDGPEGTTDPELLQWLERQPDLRVGTLRQLEKRDYDDTVLASELAAADALLERLDPRRFRVGLVTFSNRATLVAPVGTPVQQLRESLRELGRSFHRELRGTNFAKAIERAHLALVPDVASAPVDRGLVVVFLSDGAPTLPVHEGRARDHALEAAAVAGLSGIEIHAFAIGRDGAEALPLLEEMAQLTGGRADYVERPAETIDRLRRLDLARVASVSIRNETTRSAARAQRTFPDGSFDGIVELQAGPNRIRVEARSEEGKQASASRTVTLTGAELSQDEAARARALLDEMRRRSEEMRLWAEMEQRRRVQKRELDLTPVRPTPPEAGADPERSPETPGG